MKILEMRQRYGLSAGWRYSSGAGHYSWDIPVSQGTALHSDVSGLVRDCQGGVANNRPGYNPGSGAPSNWIILHTPYGGRTASVFLNHLSPNLRVKKGDRISVGQLLCYTGNSGNSTGPHLHVTTTATEAVAATRYAYLNDPESVIWEPDKVLRASGGGGGYPTPSSKKVYLSKLKYGQTDSDSVWYLQQTLNAHTLPAPGNFTIKPLSGGYFDQTDTQVRTCQQAHGSRFGQSRPDPVKQSYVGPKQAAHIFAGRGLTIINDL